MQPDCNGCTRACFLSWGAQPPRQTNDDALEGWDRLPGSREPVFRATAADGRGQKPHGLGYTLVCRARSDFCDLDHILISSAPVCRALRLSIDAGDHHGTQGLTRGLVYRGLLPLWTSLHSDGRLRPLPIAPMGGSSARLRYRTAERAQDPAACP